MSMTLMLTEYEIFHYSFFMHIDKFWNLYRNTCGRKKPRKHCSNRWHRFMRTSQWLTWQCGRYFGDFLKSKNRLVVCSSNFTPGYRPKIDEHVIPKRYVHHRDYRSTAHNSQILGFSQGAHYQMDKEMWHAYIME